MAKSSNTALIILAFFAIYVIWGSTYLLNKIAVTELPAYMLASIRFVSAGLLIFGICKILGISIKISAKQLKNSFIAGFLFLTFGNGVFVWGLKFVDSGFAALEVAAMPLIVLILMRVVDGKKIQPMSNSWDNRNLFVGESKADCSKRRNTTRNDHYIFLCFRLVCRKLICI